MQQNILIKYKHVDIYQQNYLVLKQVNLEVQSGEFIYLLGKVGSGKSSLLKSFYCEVLIQNGIAEVLNNDLHSIKLNQIPFLRRKIGIVFQDFQLLTDRSVFKNLEFVLQATGWEDKDAMNEQIEQVLRQVGMKDATLKMPYQLSGGEQQRIVIARALLNSPEIILADEPTGHLDPETGNELIDLLYNISKSGTTVIMATHNLSWIKSFPGRLIRFENNSIHEINSLKDIDTQNLAIIADNDQVVVETVVADDDAS
ncbi:MAG: phosphonate ABC transporter ATP-binding protein [Porphyromonadaceae bacterium CG2_30_38_12]|nr:MAG: phosphonate ABC transporter ATP-binding protein [Porphyromonadaceae bacterium CG2_30_38_12]